MADLSLVPIVQPVLAVAGTVIAGVLAIYIPLGLSAFTRRTGIILTDQQRATVIGAVNTAKGMLETDIDNGVISAAHINVSNPVVLAQALSVINAVPTAATALGVTPDSVARMIVGAVDTTPRPVVAPVVVAPAP